ncbi:hypothetical protein E4634_01140 [Mangrovimicrobium sediminis]|uniref:Phage tail sheath family protein n=1 Tax=Mangrovimicrobium sediminis TaxID=2562682 RepID=A0A4Z0M8Z8_9GAMM|nr:phage tail sheath C-terminal domain-containing protein [Haliea sp. SAOS-164]TGD76183.1 hypothetical protein E4634_01140 [Haliea sp. SAOS-164]
MTQYLRPGAYTERVDNAGPRRLLLRSDIPAFVGIAEQGPLDTPVPVESFRQFQACFGGFTGAGYLAYSVRAFFDNGGRRCRVVRVASRDFSEDNEVGAAAAMASVVDAGSNPGWTISAFSEGSWGDELQVALLEEGLAQASVDAGGLQSRFAAVSATAGFARGSLVRISQEDSLGGLRDFLRVVSHVDEVQRRLYWVHPEPGQGLPYDAPLQGYDLQRPARVVDIAYRVDVYRQERLLAMYSGLSLIPEHPKYAPQVLSPYRLDPADDAPPRAPAPIVIEAHAAGGVMPQPLRVVPLERIPLAGGRDGLAALSHRDFIGEAYAVGDSDEARRQRERGLASLERVAEITLVCVPDIVIRPEPDPVYLPEPTPPRDPCQPCPPHEPVRQFVAPTRERELPPVFTDEQVFQVQAAMVAQCESRGDRFAVLDSPYHIAENASAGIAEIRAWRNRFDSSYAALYYPWVKVLDPRGQGEVRAVPPSGHVLGQYALFDNETGVHRAPANRPLHWLQDLSLHSTYGQQELLNPLAVNLLRSEGPRGIRVMGARTLSSDPDWRYVNVRRLMIMLRRTLDIISQWVVFEPNHALTRNKFQVAISSYLSALWTRGALAGATQQAAFFVKCDEENNPAAQRDNGWLLAQIGVAPSKPFEFVVVRVGLQENEMTVSEVTADGAGQP